MLFNFQFCLLRVFELLHLAARFEFFCPSQKYYLTLTEIFHRQGNCKSLPAAGARCAAQRLNNRGGGTEQGRESPILL